MVFVFLAVSAVALFSFLSMNVYVDGRRKERESYYKSETLRRITESQGTGGASAIEFLREEDRLRRLRTLEGIKLGGLITSAVGVALIVFLAVIVDSSHHVVAVAGLIPLLVGVALLVYAYRLAPQPQ